MLNLYIRDGVVISSHAQSASPDPSVYGKGISVLSWSNGLDALERVGDPKAEGEADLRPYVAPKVSFEQTKADTLAAMLSKAEEYVAPFIAGYSPTERLSWDAQEAEARSVVDGSLKPSDASLLMDIAGSHQAVAAIAPKVLAKASIFRKVVAAQIRIRKAAKDAIAGASDHSELKAAIQALTKQAETAQAELLAAASGG